MNHFNTYCKCDSYYNLDQLEILVKIHTKTFLNSYPTITRNRCCCLVINFSCCILVLFIRFLAVHKLVYISLREMGKEICIKVGRVSS